MTDRVAGFVVTLKQNIRTDDIENLRGLIEHLAPVLSVENVISDPGLAIAEMRARERARDVLYRALEELR